MTVIYQSKGMKTINIYTDGACSKNPGIGGFGALLRYKGHEKEISGGEELTTNNRMELRAVIEAVKAITEPAHLIITTDSKYVMDGVTKWLAGWIKNSWRKSDKKPVLNSDLWQEYVKISKTHKIEWVWVKGHNGHAENERVDELARQEIIKIKQALGEV